VRVLRAWLGLSGLIAAVWLSVLALIYLLEGILLAYREPLLRALLGLVALGAWVTLMALVVEAVRRAMGSKAAPEKSA